MDKIAVAYKAAYLSKINIDEEKLDELLEEESYLTADECVEMGFADEVLDLDEKNSINQYSSRFLFNLVNKLRKKPEEKDTKKATKKSNDKTMKNKSTKTTKKKTKDETK